MHPAPLEHAAEREDVARVVVDQQHSLADQILVRAVQPLDHLLFLGRKITDDAMQKQGRFVQQPLGRFDTLDHDATGHRMELGVFFRRQLASGKDDDRQVGQRRAVADFFEQVEAGHVGQPQVKHDAIGRVVAQDLERRRARSDRLHVDIVMRHQLGDAELFGQIIFDHEQAFPAWLHEILDAGQCRLQVFGPRRFDHEREGAARQPVLAILVEREYLNRNVPRHRVLLELAQNGPAEHVGQEHIERNRGRSVFTGERERIGASGRDQDLQSSIVGEIRKYPSVMRIVLDDQ
jgi:hypothetical protein